MADLPTGTVTLLFTDIEGSTRLLQGLGRDRYVEALTVHRQLLREAFTSHGGVEVEMQGDSFFMRFPFDEARRARLVAAAKAALGEEEFEQARAEGAALAPEEALELGLTGDGTT